MVGNVTGASCMMEETRPCRTCLAKKAQKNVSDLKHEGSNSTWSEIMLFCLDIKVTDNTEESTKLCLKCYKKVLMFYSFKLQAQKNDKILKNTKVEPAAGKHKVFVSHEVKSKEGSNDKFVSFLNKGSANTEVKIELEISEDGKDDWPSELETEENGKEDWLSEVEIEQDGKDYWSSELETEENGNDDCPSELETKVNGKDDWPSPSELETIANGKDDWPSEVEIEEDGKDKLLSDDELLTVIQNIKYEYVPEEKFEQSKENEPMTKKSKAKIKVSKDMDPNWVPPGTSSVSKGKVNKSKICGECGKSVVNLKHHMQLHKPAKLRQKFRCKMCDKSFTTDSGRRRHTRIKHLGIKPHCKICNKAVSHLRVHTLMKHETSQLPFACASCDRRFLSQSKLDAHTPIHSGDLPFPCEQCDKKFISKTRMKEHTRQLHNQEKSFLCQYCSKTFFSKRSLQIHIRSHTKEKPYRCSECGKFFSSTTALRAHRAVHSDSKDYSCQICSKAFAHPRYLSNHMVTHTREKKYPCKYCGRKFHRSDHCKVHQFTVHEKPMIANSPHDPPT